MQRVSGGAFVQGVYLDSRAPALTAACKQRRVRDGKCAPRGGCCAWWCECCRVRLAVAVYLQNPTNTAQLSHPITVTPVTTQCVTSGLTQNTPCLTLPAAQPAACSHWGCLGKQLLGGLTAPVPGRACLQQRTASSRSSQSATIPPRAPRETATHAPTPPVGKQPPLRRLLDARSCPAKPQRTCEG